MPSTIPYLGEVLSLFSAVLWGLAVVFFRKSGERVHPLALNTFKNLLAIILFVPTILLFGETLFRPEPINIYLLLFLSGVAGISLGDTLLFASLNKLGAGLTGIVVCMYSPFIITLSIIFLHETLSLIQVAGAITIITAVLLATVEKGERAVKGKNLALGVLLGIVASAGSAVGVVIMKPILNTVPLLWATEIRLIGGTLGLFLIIILLPKNNGIIASLTKTNTWSYTILGSLIGAYLAMAVWLAGMKYTQASIASALNQTSTIFIFIFASIILKEPIKARKVMGIILAFIGSFLVSFG